MINSKKGLCVYKKIHKLVVAMLVVSMIISISPVFAESGTAKVLKPEASGKDTKTGSGVTIDYSNCNSGYIMVKYTGSGKIKVIISKSGSKDYTYDLFGNDYTVYPLTFGNGTYKVGVYKNVSGTQYSTLTSASFSVKLKNSNLPFLYPNQFVNFTAKSNAITKSNSVVKGKTTEIDKIEAIYNYVISNLTYDTQKAKTVKSGYIPKIDEILKSGTGICFDYASLMVAMMRAQGIPTKLEFGYVSGGVYHAWVSTYIKDIGWVNGIIQFDGVSWKRMDPTFASSGGSNINNFIGDGTNYKTQYIY